AVDANRAEQDPPARALTRHACLDAMAQGWANQMAARQLSGSVHNPNLTVQARACGMRSWGENVGRTWGSDRPDPERMMAAWLTSPGHVANIQRASSEL